MNEINWEKSIWLAIAVFSMGAVGTYFVAQDGKLGGPRFHDGSESAQAKDSEEPTTAAEPASSHDSDKARSEPKSSKAMAKDRTRRAMLDAVARARAQIDQSPLPPAGSAKSTNGRAMPDVAMTWDQYRGWTRFAAALARRDYQNVEGMLDAMHQLFGEPIADAMLDAYVEDYQSFLSTVSASRCDGFDPQSVWRKTMFMTFALARLNRSSATLDRSANQVRELCGYAG